VDQVTLIINQDVAVVSVFDLEDIAHHTVRSQTLYTVEPGSHEGFARFISILLQEVLVEIDLKGFSDLISAVCVGHNLNNTTEKVLGACSVADAFIRRHKQVKIAFFEYLLEELDKLQGKDILSEVIIDLEDD